MKLILIILLVIVIGLVTYYYCKKMNKVVVQANGENTQTSTIDSPISFGYKCMWIAVKTGGKSKGCSTIGIGSAHAENWKKGIEAAYNGKVFITPQIGEWTLIVGYGLADKNSKNELEEIKSYEDKINKLSKVFGAA